LVTLFTALSAVACRQDMHQAPRYDPLEQSDFFRDQRASRTLVDGTVARGLLRADKAFYAGRNGTELVSEIPVPVTAELLLRGQNRYEIYCTPCHSHAGDGNGMVVQRGFKRPPSYHEERLRNMPIGHFYDVMTNGFGAMQDYAAQLQPEDRWAVAAYIRALQFSRSAPADALSDADRQQLEAAGQRPAATPAEGTPER
jgi:mono/diheme cytochrome c family protein